MTQIDHQLTELGKLRRCAWGNARQLDVTNRFHERHTLHPGEVAELIDRRGADAALRFVDDTDEGDVLVRVGDQAQIRQDVFDFFSFIELCPADHLIRDVRLEQHLFKSTRLSVRPIQNGHFAVIDTLLAEFFHLIDDKERFIPVI